MNSGYSPEEQLQFVLEAARRTAAKTGTVRQINLRHELRAMNAPFGTEAGLRVSLGIGVTDIKRHILYGEPLVARYGVDGHQPIAPAPGQEPEPGAPPDPEEIWDRLRGHSEGRIDKEIQQRFRSVDLTCGAPVGLLCMGDLHIGHQAVDYRRIDWCIEQTLRDDVAVRAVQVGDATDNLFWVVSEVAKQAGEMPEQAVAVARVFGMMGDRLIGVVPGNHDQFGQSRTGSCIWDTVSALCPGLVWDPNELVLDITVGDGDPYRWVIRHKVRGRSMYRASHGVQRWLMDDSWHDADGVIAGDIHQAGYYHGAHHGKMRHGVQLGTYKAPEGVGDEYAVRQGFSSNGLYCPDMLAIMHTDTRRIEVFDDTERGLMVLEDLTKRAGAAPCQKKKKAGKKGASGKPRKRAASPDGGSRSPRTGKATPASSSGTKGRRASRRPSKTTRRKTGK